MAMQIAAYTTALVLFCGKVLLPKKISVTVSIADKASIEKSVSIHRGTKLSL